MLWLRYEQPTVFERAAGLLLPGSALLAWLTGERLLDHANASSTLLYDITTRDWSPEMLQATGIDAGRLGTIAAAADVAGTLRPDAADALGLTTTTRVVVGTGDEHGAALGAGGIRPGIVVDITGTAEPVGVAATSPVVDETGLVETHGHADPRVWLVENPGFVSGGSVAWFTEAFGGGATAAELDDEATAGTAPAADGVTFLPTLSGATAPRWNDRARGVFAGLSLNHGRAHLYRALLEGCTFALRDIVDRLDAMGLVGDEIRVVGGGARSPLWLQMKADVTGRSVRVMASDESTALGAAMLAAVGGGIFAGLDEAVERLATLEPRVYEPNPATTGAYDDAYGRYRALFDALEPGFGTLSKVAAPKSASRYDRSRAAPRSDSTSPRCVRGWPTTRRAAAARSAWARSASPPMRSRIWSTTSPRSAERARSSWSSTRRRCAAPTATSNRTSTHCSARTSRHGPSPSAPRPGAARGRRRAGPGRCRHRGSRLRRVGRLRDGHGRCQGRLDARRRHPVRGRPDGRVGQRVLGRHGACFCGTASSARSPRAGRTS